MPRRVIRSVKVHLHGLLYYNTTSFNYKKSPTKPKLKLWSEFHISELNNNGIKNVDSCSTLPLLHQYLDSERENMSNNSNVILANRNRRTWHLIYFRLAAKVSSNLPFKCQIIDTARNIRTHYIHYLWRQHTHRGHDHHILVWIFHALQRHHRDVGRHFSKTVSIFSVLFSLWDAGVGEGRIDIFKG